MFRTEKKIKIHKSEFPHSKSKKRETAFCQTTLRIIHLASVIITKVLRKIE